MKDKVSVSIDKHEWEPSPLPGQVVLVTTLDEGGAPGIATKSWISMAAFGPPPVLMFGCNRDHATFRNAERTGEFVVNVPGDDLVATCWKLGTDQNVSAADRWERHGLTAVPSEEVGPPRVEQCRAHLECRLDGTRTWQDDAVVFGKIVAASMDDELLQGLPGERYRKLAPFFFLQGGWAAGLGGARPTEVGSVRHPYTFLAVSDLARSVTFYREAFGWPPRIEVPVLVELEMPDGRGLGLYQSEAFGINTEQVPSPVPAGGISGTELYFYCDDLDGVISRLQGLGARMLSARAPRGWGDEVAYFSDPDGNVLAVARRCTGG